MNSVQLPEQCKLEPISGVMRSRELRKIQPELVVRSKQHEVEILDK